MIRTLALLAVLLASSCSGPDTWTDVPGANLEPSGRAGWDEAVHEGVLRWDEALVDLGCPPAFFVDPGAGPGHPVKLVDEADWQHGSNIGGMTHDNWDTTLVNDWADEWIEVRDRFPDRDPIDWALPVILHELGHAIGLEHRDDVLETVMRPAPWQTTVFPVDAEEAASVLGCGTIGA